VSRASTVLPVDPGRAFQLLEDPRSLRAMVAGAHRIRRFDPRWPDVGSAVHHSVGLPPLVLRDVTVVMECLPGRRLVLEARLRFLGVLIVEFTERPASGAVTQPGLRSIVEGATALRNAELCRRFARLIRRRERFAATAVRNAPSPVSESRA
jgi:hypothetical protein